MKRKLFAAVLVLALLVSGYTLYAYLSTRGLRVYLMGTQMGAVLAGSWQFTFLAAVVLWSPGVVALVRKAAGLRGRKMAPGQAEDATEILQQGGWRQQSASNREKGRRMLLETGAYGNAKRQRRRCVKLLQRQSRMEGAMAPWRPQSCWSRGAAVWRRQRFWSLMGMESSR